MRGRWTLAALLAMLCALVPVRSNASETVRVHIGGRTVEMDAEAYVAGVVAAEMPAAYETEALKAQAVVARTRAARGGCASHPGADACGDSGCCQAYLDEAAQRARWGADFNFYSEKISSAVAETRGEILTYGGEPILVLYHAVSGGRTEDVEEVFGEALPYLRSVTSPGEEGASSFETVSFFSDDAIRLAFPGEAEDGRVGFAILSRTDSGRVASIRVGAHAMTGRTFRAALGLKSTNFDLTEKDGGVEIRQRGYGHGVGMSQAGANAMAAEGADYKKILLHYYAGVTIENIWHDSP